MISQDIYDRNIHLRQPMVVVFSGSVVLARAAGRNHARPSKKLTVGRTFTPFQSLMANRINYQAILFKGFGPVVES